MLRSLEKYLFKVKVPNVKVRYRFKYIDLNINLINIFSHLFNLVLKSQCYKPSVENEDVWHLQLPDSIAKIMHIAISL